MKIGEHIKDLRKMHGLSQRELAQKAGVSLMSIRRYESGDREPRHDTLERIANALDEHVMFFYGVREFREESISPNNSENLYPIPRRKYNEIESLLSRIYKKVEFKEIAGYDWLAQYYLISEQNGDSFILYDEDLEALYNATAGYLPAIVNRLKDTRNEKELIADFQEWRTSGKKVRASIFNIRPLEARLSDKGKDPPQPE